MTTTALIADLNRRFQIPGVATITVGQGGLPMISISAPSAAANIYLQGAHITSWKPAKASEVLFLSSKAKFEAGIPIRGGIPVCFPWFRDKADDPKAPKHGFVRTKSWELRSVEQSGDNVIVSLLTANDESSRKWWPHEFSLLYRVLIGSSLRLELILTNTGNAPLRFEEALHTYHHVGDIASVRISGLDGISYLDNTDSNREKTQVGEIEFSRQTDNAYLETQGPVDVVDDSLGRRIRTTKQNSDTTVVWNPWQDGAEPLADMGPQEWRRMVCAEASNIRAFAVDLVPGSSHTLAVTLSLDESAK